MIIDFPPVSKADWLRQVAADLKDRRLDDFRWVAPDGTPVSPFVHADDFETPPDPITAQPKSWEICEDVPVSDPVAANRQALEALEGGAEALCFGLPGHFEPDSFGQLLAGIHLDFIGLHFEGTGVAQNPGMVLANLERLAQQRGLPTTALRGSLAYNPVPVSSVVDWRYLAELLEYAREKFPQFKLISIDLPTISEDASSALKTANTYLQKLSEHGQPVNEVAAVIQFNAPVGKSYFMEIARLRAFKLLWLNVLKGWGAELRYPGIAAHYQPEAYSDELYTNMVRATTMAMSAVLGGADRLSVRPYDAGRESQAKYPQAFARRIARNVQHLLKMESSFDAVADPAAGSYYIETLTRQLAEKTWGAFSDASSGKHV